MSHDKQENQEIQPCRKFVATDRPATSQDRQQLLVTAYRHPSRHVTGKPGTYLTQHGKSNNGGQAADRQRTPHRKPVATDAVRQSRPSRRSDGIRNDRRFVPAPWRISEAKTRGNGVPDHALPCTPKSSAIHERRRRRIYERGGSRPPLSYIDVPRLSDERAGSAGTYFTGFPWLSTTTRSPRPSERTPANCVLASPTMTIVIRSKSIYCPITCLASSRVISLSVCSLRLT